jgi:hypothetical protein
MSAHTFATSPYHDSVLRVRRSMFNDIEKTIGLANNQTIGAPNFLLALGLCCYTEYWGKLVKAIKKGDESHGKTAFYAFLERMDSAYYGHLINSGVKLYKEVRCGLAHAYLIEASGCFKHSRISFCVSSIAFNRISYVSLSWVTSVYAS